MMVKRGFTLIELLIVITLLGILAVAVLSAINPIEQINRSRDTSSRSDAEQLINAVERFYASKGFFPWRVTETVEPGETIGVDWTVVNNEDFLDTEGTAVVQKLSSDATAELKESFINRISAARANSLYIFNRGQQGDSTYVCFRPRSASFLDDATNRCDEGGDYGSLPDDYPPEACAGGDEIYNCLP
ncbi:MAG: type II secretion system protein [Candidatus Shapirobacteria bacterium]|nr:type II secretion system protein [Candidatus Shapirobacteria bacterium]